MAQEYEILNDPVNHPSHYTQGKVECIDAMEMVFGKEAVINFANEKYKLSKYDILVKLQRYVNSPMIFNTVDRFEDYERLTNEQMEQVRRLGI